MLRSRFVTPRLAAAVVLAGGVVLLMALLPLFDAAQPRGLRITQSRARTVADVEARRMGIETDKSWVVTVWQDSPILEQELAASRDRRRQASVDAVLGPRLGSYRTTYFRRGLEKIPFGYVVIDNSGELVAARRIARPEEPGKHPTPEALRQVADSFVASRSLKGSPNPVFDSVRPTVLRFRTDHVIRYRIPNAFPAGGVACYLGVHFIGDQFAGWSVMEEYRDGSLFRDNSSEGLAWTFFQFLMMFALLLLLLIIFLKKYHAGEVGVGAGALLFGIVIALSLIFNYSIAGYAAMGISFGSADALLTAVANIGFKFLFIDLILALLVFVAWAVGESYARERWGERLASFDAILRRDVRNSTVGRSILTGLLASPSVAAAALLVAAIPLALGLANPVLGGQRELLMSTVLGPATVVVNAAIDSIIMTVIIVLFVLAASHRRRVLPVGIVVACLLGAIASACDPSIAPLLYKTAFGFGGILACAVVFLWADLLAAGMAFFSATLLLGFLPYLRVVGGAPATEALGALVAPLAALLVIAVTGVASGREVVYEPQGLAAHVRRIMERERVKAEIDAANRIQAALLPTEDPRLEGICIASHYRAASEIGGDYFDFLPVKGGLIGLAFGDVSGHGLTSGIMMAMAKSALLVQIEYDSSPVRVLEVLNECVIKTAPKRMLMTFFFGLLDPRNHYLRFSSAGHHDPYVYRAGAKTLHSLSSWGYPLGVKRREPYREQSVSFEPGDRLILYSDGLIEALDDHGEPFGFERFEQVLMREGRGSAEEIKHALLHSVRKFTRNRPPEDDQTLVVVTFEQFAQNRLPKIA